MNIFANLPTWANEAIAWITTGSNIITVIGIIVAIIKLKTSSNEAKATTMAQINLLEVMTSKLSDTKDLSANVGAVLSRVTDALAYFEKAIDAQKQSNANLANFVMECFNKSNLTDEAKADLKIIADKIFYDDNNSLIDALKQAKLEAEREVIESKKKVEELETELAVKKEKLIQAQENIKTNRRV